MIISAREVALFIEIPLALSIDPGNHPNSQACLGDVLEVTVAWLSCNCCKNLILDVQPGRGLRVCVSLLAELTFLR